MKFIEQIETLLSPVIHAMGYELWGVELENNQPLLLRVYLECLPVSEVTAPAQEQGLTISDCVRASRQIRAILAVEQILNDYTLEVSSPGIARRLFKLEHYQKYLNRKIKVQLMKQPRISQLRSERKVIVGILQAINNGILTLLVDTELLSIAIADINKANLNL